MSYFELSQKTEEQLMEIQWYYLKRDGKKPSRKEILEGLIEKEADRLEAEGK